MGAGGYGFDRAACEKELKLTHYQLAQRGAKTIGLIQVSLCSFIFENHSTASFPVLRFAVFNCSKNRELVIVP